MLTHSQAHVVHFESLYLCITVVTQDDHSIIKRNHENKRNWLQCLKCIMKLCHSQTKTVKRLSRTFESNSLSRVYTCLWQVRSSNQICPTINFFKSRLIWYFEGASIVSSVKCRHTGANHDSCSVAITVFYIILPPIWLFKRGVKLSHPSSHLLLFFSCTTALLHSYVVESENANYYTIFTRPSLWTDSLLLDPRQSKKWQDSSFSYGYG